MTSLFLGGRHDELISDDLVFSGSSKNDELTSQTCHEKVNSSLTNDTYDFESIQLLWLELVLIFIQLNAKISDAF